MGDSAFLISGKMKRVNRRFEIWGMYYGLDED
jgi:hypothetical protein